MNHSISLQQDSRYNRSEYSIPSKKNIPKELYGIIEFAGLFTKLPDLMKLPRSGKGQVVLVLPGYSTDDRIMSPLRQFINFLGYEARGWGLGENDGNVPILLEDVKKLIHHYYAKSNSKIILIGWK
jgi:hypothetical protein